MSSKKIKLSTSVNKLNEKVKQKKKKSTKLRLVLADPYKYLIPTLSPYKASELCDFVQNEMTKTGWPGREFAKRFGISLGMASALRCINRRNAACVLVSKAVKPKFILQQIAYFARQRNNKCSVFLVAGLDELAKKMFGIKSTVMAFSNNTSPKIAEWIVKQSLVKESSVPMTPIARNLVKPVTISNPFDKLDLRAALIRKENNGERVFIPGKLINHSQQIIDQRMRLTGDYVPLVGQSTNTRKNIRVTDADLEQGRVNMLKKFTKISKRAEDTERPSVKKSNKEQSKPDAPPKLPKIVYEEYDEDYDFPTSYVRFKTLSFLSDRHKSKREKS